MDLQAIGLSPYEDKTYRALILLGTSTASAISAESQVSYGRIYEVLSSLERKGLVKTIPEKTKKFRATNPEKIHEIAQKKKEELEELQKEVADLKQLYHSQETEAVTVVKGKRNFYQVIKERKKPKTFFYAVKYNAEYHHKWVREDKDLLKKGIDIKVLARNVKDTQKDIERWKKHHKNIREFPNKGVAMSVTDDEVVIALIAKNTILSIKDDHFSEIIKKMFIRSYDQAKEIN